VSTICRLVQVQCVAKQFRFNVFGYARPFRPPVNDILIKRELDRNFAKWVLFGHCRVATSQLAHLHGVTGPKTDLWLVKTVAALLSAVGIALIVASTTQKKRPTLKRTKLFRGRHSSGIVPGVKFAKTAVRG
jgi:hypothetical protein